MQSKILSIFAALDLAFAPRQFRCSASFYMRRLQLQTYLGHMVEYIYTFENCIVKRIKGLVKYVLRGPNAGESLRMVRFKFY